MQVSLNDISRAYAVHEIDLGELCISLAKSNYSKNQDKSITETPLKKYFDFISSEEFSKLPEIEKARFRIQQFKLIESENAINTPERYKLYNILLTMWENNSIYERNCLKKIIAEAPLRHGVWKAIKKIFKESEDKNDTDMLGAISSRLDTVYANKEFNNEVTLGTILYMVRRGWRYLRNIGENFPSFYCQSAVDFLKAYPENINYKKTWILNHIFFHESGKYSGKKFKDSLKYNDYLRYRAFSALWKRSPIPLIRLMEEANSSLVLKFAFSSLKNEHLINLREINEISVLRLLKKQNSDVDEFCVWIFDTVPKFEQSRLKELGLHDAILELFKSSNPKALTFFAIYARTHAKDLALSQVIELINHENKDIRDLAVSFLMDRDPRKDVGLESWTKLLGTEYGNNLAEEGIIKNFSAKDLTKEWFSKNILDDNASEFAQKHLLKIHKIKDLGVKYFIDLFYSEKFSDLCVDFIMENIRKFGIEELDTEFLHHALFCIITSDYVLDWVKSGYCDSKLFGVDFLISLAYEPEWEKNEWIQNLIKNDKDNLKYPEEIDEMLSEKIFSWLSDVRKFQPKEIGFERLMQLVERKEASYHKFASQYMIKAFVPSDFVSNENDSKPTQNQKEAITVDLKGMTFLFTGKLKTMTRSESEDKVKNANGVNASGVTKNLDYLVIGDDGSPLYGGGKKGSKQIKGESLINEGSNLKIISETAFLQMLVGRTNDADSGTVEAGCEKLWELLTKKGSEQSPLRLFAINYLKNHHQDIYPLLTERFVDPGAEIPHEFFTFERLLPLFKENRHILVDFALEISPWEASKWKPDFKELMALFEKGHVKVKEFFAKALTCGPEKAHDRYRLSSDLLKADYVYSLCESPDSFTKNLGMQILKQNPQLSEPESLFRLTESTDNKIRYFAVETIWHNYREKGISANWSFPVIIEGEKTKEKTTKKNYNGKLADFQKMKDFLRRMLYETPPGRNKGKQKGLKTLSSSKAKVALVEIYRKISLDDKNFAEIVMPILEEFMNSRGLIEEKVCLVAIARIAEKYPDLSIWKESVSQ
ncbi:MAG: BRCT domain-containing protein [Cyanobacteriota bacterium]